VNLHVRAATLEDATAIDNLLNAYALVHQGRSLEPGTAYNRLTRPDSEAALVEDATGSVVGFGHAWPAGAVVRCHARVRPDATGKGVGTALLSHLERRAGAFDLSDFNVMQPRSDTAGPGLLRARGYTEICHMLQMQVQLRAYEPPDAPVPVGVDIVSFNCHDESALFAAFQAAFPDDPAGEAEWWHERCQDPTSQFDPALWFVARQGDETVGFCLGRRRNWQGSADGYISDVGVRPSHWRRGIAFALLTTALTAFAADGLATATLDVDADNPTEAVRLYRKAGMHSSPLSTEWSKVLPA
jgi:mycothiol synthase